jgi:DegT/DnrJ/EryC1/StrS aminotransferase family
MHFIPLHLHPFNRDTFGYQPADFPQASASFERLISLPIYPRDDGNKYRGRYFSGEKDRQKKKALKRPFHPFAVLL